MSVKKRTQGSYLIENLRNPGDPILKQKTTPDGIEESLPSSKNPNLYETIIKTSFLTIDGDLIVLGDTTVENIDEVSIEDPVVTLNSIVDEIDGEEVDNIPTLIEYGVPVVGVAANRGREFDTNGNPSVTLPFRKKTLIRYNDTGADGSGTGTDTGFWEATNNGVDYYRLDDNAQFELEQDTDPHLGAHLITNGFRITTNQAINNPLLTPPGNINDIVIEADNDLTLDATNRIKANTPIGLEIVTTDPAFEPGYNSIYGKAIGSGGTGLYVKNQERTEELVSRSKAIVFGLIF